MRRRDETGRGPFRHGRLSRVLARAAAFRQAKAGVSVFDEAGFDKVGLRFNWLGPTWRCKAGEVDRTLARWVQARFGEACRVWLRWSMARQARSEKVRRIRKWHVEVGSGGAKRAMVWQGKAGPANSGGLDCPDMIRLGQARDVETGQGTAGTVGQGRMGLDLPRQARRDVVRLKSGHVLPRSGSAGGSAQGRVCSDAVWHERTWRGAVRRSRQRQGRQGHAWCGRLRPGGLGHGRLRRGEARQAG